MSLISIFDAHLAYGDRPLLDGAQLTVSAGERIGLIGRNGTGKSTLLKVLADTQRLDDGEVQRRNGLAIHFVEQEPALAPAPTLRESLTVALGDAEEHGDWRRTSLLEEYLDRFALDGDHVTERASGGERKKGALAVAFARQPELLLLDEPTNHLDIEAIERLEELLLKVPACIVITHDRAFLDRVATRIVELDRGVLRSYPGNFAAYEARKSDELAAEDLANRRFDKFWAQEEVWIRKGVEARRTRNEGRVKRLEHLRVERADRRNRLGNIDLRMDTGERSGKLVVELENVDKYFGARAIVRDFSVRIMRGDRVGLIGPNGAGKSTLIRVLLGELSADAGTVRLGTNVTVAYFDQLREQLDPELTLADTISPGSDWVEVGGSRKHVISYLGDFLFAAQRAQSPVKMLSGGERNRLLLARLFARPANLVVLDEPTNDLDIESLELLEQNLQDYSGTLLLVSHDRRFLDNVVTQTIAAEGGGRWRQYVGGYTDWLAQRPRGREKESRRAAPAAAGSPNPVSAPAKSRARMSFKEQRELESLPGEIEMLEREQAELIARMSDAAYHKAAPEKRREDTKRGAEIETLLLQKFERWAKLEESKPA